MLSLNVLQLGLEVKVKPTEELTEAVETTEDVDPEEEIEVEVRLHMISHWSSYSCYLAAGAFERRSRCTTQAGASKS